MEIRQYFRILGRFWWVIVIAALAAGLGAFVLTRVREPTYNTSARFVIRPAANLTNESAVIDLIGQLGNRYIGGTYAQAVTGAAVVAQARSAAGLVVPPAEGPDPESRLDATNYKIEAVLQPEAMVVEVTGSGPDPQLLTNYVNATVDATFTSTASYFQVLQLETLAPATVPEDPISPVPARDVPLGLGLGLAVGILLALALDYLLVPVAAGAATATPEPESGFLRPPLRRIRQG